ncbi:acyl-CoA Delta-9 desaturase [Euwallacea fornicatus]|uniref:acyl-CoA Delta-9 desaturase n=1 Tax=Euwallacea fornicatus TaxID=995702 RepID=UPI00339053A7
MDKPLSTKREINWMKVLFQLQVASSAIFTIGYLVKNGCMYRTFFFFIFLTMLGAIGQFAGAHRLWAHNSYTATVGLKIFLMICHTLVGHGTIYDWVVWHRLHHKHFKTDLDPYNNKNGFFYSHFVSLMKNLSPAQIEAIKELDVSDLENDKVVMFQKKWNTFLYILLVLLLPINTPCEYWGENIVTSLMVVGWLRYALTLHLTWLLHSAISIWDLKPGEKFPADTNWIFLVTKTYWISYHYFAPWDYQTSEFGKYGTDYITKFIRVCEALGYASDLKMLDSNGVRTALFKSASENISIDKSLAEYTEIDKLKTVNQMAPILCC